MNEDDNIVITGSDYKTVKVLNLVGGKEIFTFEGYQRNLNYFAMNSDCTRVMAGILYGTVKLWDLLGGKKCSPWSGKMLVSLLCHEYRWHKRNKC